MENQKAGGVLPTESNREPGEMMMKLIVQGQRPGIVGATGISPRV